MAKKKTQNIEQPRQEIKYFCRDCKHSTPDPQYFRNKDKSPIFASCPHQRHLMFLDHDYCDKFERK